MLAKKERERRYYLAHREEKLAYAKEYRQKNREKAMAYAKSYYQIHRDEMKADQIKRNRSQRENHNEYVRERDRKRYARRRDEIYLYQQNYREKHRERLRESARKNMARRLLNPGTRLVHTLRARMNNVLNGKCKSAKSVELIGCSPEFLRGYIEAKFLPGMTWKNIHIDHIRPCFSFDLSDPAQQRECFNYRNLQPLFAVDNLRKGAKTA